MGYRTLLLCSASAAVMVSTGALAGDPTAAVSDSALTVETSGGSVGGRGIVAGAASLVLPITHDFGVQLDGDIGKSGDAGRKGTGQGGLGFHLFTRDPESYLVGATAMWSRIGNYEVYRYGIEGQAYLGDFTLSPSIGLQRGDANQGTSNSAYAGLAADYYVSETLKVGVAATGYSDYRATFAEVEWQPSASVPLSLFADAGASVTVDHRGLVFAGLRYTFGAPDTSLKDRHRHGDPENIVRFMQMTSGTQPIETLRNPVVPKVAIAPAFDECCFVAGTPVRLADGSVKAIEDVIVGDRVIGRDGIVNTVMGLSRPPLGSRRLYAINDLGPFMTPEHPVLTTKGWKSFDPNATRATTNAVNVTQLSVGDHLVTLDGLVEITSIATANDDPRLTVYNFRLDGDDTYNAHGIIAHSYGRPVHGLKHRARQEELLPA